MPETPKISAAEWELMRILWARAPRAASEVIEEVRGHQSWSPKTVRTLLARLVAKGALGYTKEGRVHLYRPLVSEAQCVREESRSFLERVFGGTLQPMLAHFVESHDLTPQQIEELREILDRAVEQR